MSMPDSSDTPADDVFVPREVNRSLEDPARYQPGGYHPIAIDDELHDGRYRVIHRISHGAYSTVWMAMDQRHQSDGRGAYAGHVAVKIGTARYDDREASLLRRLHDTPKSHLCDRDLATADLDVSRFVVAVLDEFDIHGPNGTHHCVVTELLGPTIAAVMDCSAIQGWGRLPRDIVRRTAVQCAEALVSLHCQGIVHADLHPRNIAFALTVDIHAWSVEEVYEALGHPITVSMQEALEGAFGAAPQSSEISAHQPQYLVHPPLVSRFWALCSSSPSNIRLIDFTESFAVPFMGRLPGTARNVAAPELLLRLPSEVTPAIDVWALGCVIFRVVSEDSPFGGLNGPLGDYLATIMLSLGGETSMPDRFMDAFRECGTMTWAQYPGREESNWDEKFTRLREDPVTALGQEDESVLRKVVGAALLVDPRERASAAEILALLLQGWPNI
ncbi:kinase-like domain-containing protein [Sphaerosporella brunnea]|uniref:non-specific serine/threonine protein kinase n=1 Tax=Sphaerosporella brunnea TaxID=1250544 RepID=A0A5J5EZE3_9PEZI|nr:kinase-like domain-containing protein [Sphaerosporella brunnea]